MNNIIKYFFDKAYQEYMEISDSIKEVYASNGAIARQYKIQNEKDLLISFDEYVLHGISELAVAGDMISDEKRVFITDFVDNYDEICSLHIGYREFLQYLSSESYFYSENKPYITISDNKPWLDFVTDIKKAYVPHIIKKCADMFEIIYNCFIEGSNDSERKRKTLKKLVNELKLEYVDAYQEDNPSSFERPEDDQLEKAIQKLDALIGLNSVKRDIHSEINFIKMNVARANLGYDKVSITRHLVFSGNPGTGKTTVARILAEIYKSLGLLSKGHCIEVGRSDLVAGYVGQTAIKTKQKIDEALGGVLFIDEAYSLNQGDSNDFGQEAVDTLVQYMENYRTDLIVIVAGYTKEIRGFINMNPGLKSRFTKEFQFEDYSAEECYDIFKSLCNQNGYIISESSEVLIKAKLQNRAYDVNFGNGRGVRNYFERIIQNKANNITNFNDEKQLMTIYDDDVTGVVIDNMDVNASNPAIGFS